MELRRFCVIINENIIMNVKNSSLYKIIPSNNKQALKGTRENVILSS